jgi:glycosyltransferase involved in cell wall biosynthesis
MANTDLDFNRLLKQFVSYPEGSASDWKSHYKPLVDSVIVHLEKTDPIISVIVVVYHSSEILLDCLEQVRNQEEIDNSDIELILVDNTGIESLRPFLNKFVDVEIRMKGNAHVCRARNIGAAFAKAPIINFLDDDGLMQPDYIKEGLKYFGDSSITAIRTRIKALNHRYFTSIADHYSQGSDVIEDCLQTEGSLFIRHDIFIEVRGFEETLFGGDGIDLTYRILTTNPSTKIFYVPDVVLQHDYINSWKKFFKKCWRYATVNTKLKEIDPGLIRFLDEYLPHDFIRDPLPLDEQIARVLLRLIRKIIWKIAQLTTAIRKNKDQKELV